VIPTSKEHRKQSGNPETFPYLLTDAVISPRVTRQKFPQKICKIAKESKLLLSLQIRSPSTR
jgi:hypothetical protein